MTENRDYSDDFYIVFDKHFSYLKCERCQKHYPPEWLSECPYCVEHDALEEARKARINEEILRDFVEYYETEIRAHFYEKHARPKNLAFISAYRAIKKATRTYERLPKDYHGNFITHDHHAPLPFTTIYQWQDEQKKLAPWLSKLYEENLTEVKEKLVKVGKTIESAEQLEKQKRKDLLALIDYLARQPVLCEVCGVEVKTRHVGKGKGKGSISVRAMKRRPKVPLCDLHYKEAQRRRNTELKRKIRQSKKKVAKRRPKVSITVTS